VKQGKNIKDLDGNLMSDYVELNKIPLFPSIEKSSRKGYIKHVKCHGARFHVVHWDDL
jgi:hypothetical protein